MIKKHNYETHQLNKIITDLQQKLKEKDQQCLSNLKQNEQLIDRENQMKFRIEKLQFSYKELYEKTTKLIENKESEKNN